MQAERLRRTLALLILIGSALPGRAGQLTVTVRTEVPGYSLVRTAYTVTVFDDGTTRTTAVSDHEIVTVGGPNDGRRRTVPGSTTSRPSPTGEPDGWVTDFPEEIVSSVETTYSTESATVYYDSDLTLASLTRGSEIEIPPFAFDPPSDIVDEAEEAVAPVAERVEAEYGAVLTAGTVRAATVDRTASEADSALAGDPVSVSTGAFVAAEVDLAVDVGEIDLRFERVHRTGMGAGGSLGPGWYFALDSRVVLGESPAASGAAARIADLVRELIDPASPLRRRVEESVAAAIAEREGPRREAAGAAGEARELEGAVAGANYSGPLESEVRAAIAATAGEAAAIARELEAIVAELAGEIDRIRTEVRDAAIAVIEAAAADARERADALLDIAAWSAEHAARNARYRSVSLAGAPEAVGPQAVILVDPQGHPRRFTLACSPDDGQTLRYADGSRNRYPLGCDFDPADPRAGRLRLEPDGSFVLVTEGGTRYRYGFYGELRRVEDRNGNAVDLFYEDERLVRLVDTRGRVFAIDRDGAGRVTTISGPLGVTIGFSYVAGLLKSVTDPTGNRTSYAYAGTAGERLETITLPDGSSRGFGHELIRGRWRTVLVRDEEGGVERFAYPREGVAIHTNPSGVQTRYEYDERSRTTRIVHAEGAAESFLYDAQGNLVEHRRVDGTRLRYGYDDGGNPITVLHPDGTDERREYDGEGRLVLTVDRDGLATRFVHDGHGRVVRIDYPDGTTDEYTYIGPGAAAAGSVAAHTDRRGNRSAYAYDEHGFASRVVDSEGPVITADNDAYGRPLAVTDGTGATTRFAYRVDGLLEEVLGPEELSLRITYDARGNPVLIVENGRPTTIVYDRRHRILAVHDALDRVTRFAYRADGAVIERWLQSEPDAGGPGPDGRFESVERYEYDEAGRLRSIHQGGIDAWTRYEYDAAGRLAAQIDTAGARTEYRWDADGRLAATVRYLSGEPVEERYAYAPTGSLRERVDANGAIWRWTSDGRAGSTLATDPTGRTSIVERDPYGLVTRIVDGAGRRRRFSHDTRGRPTAVWNELWQEASYEYDAANRLVAFVDGEDSRWEYSYDGRGRLVATTNPDGSVQTAAYNRDGTIAAEIDETGLVTTYEYDAVGRLTSVVQAGADGRERRTSVARAFPSGIAALTDATGRTTRYEHDTAGHVTATVDAAGARTTFELDPTGRILAVVDPSGRRAWRRYDELGRLTAVGRADLTQTTLAYDRAGNLVTETDGAGHAHRYEYDAAGRLVAETNRLGARATYGYDDAGRLAAAVDFTGVVAGYEHDAGGAVAAVAFSDGTFAAYERDRAGRLTAARNSDEELLLGYDTRGRLSGVRGSGSGTDARFTHDGAGRRLTREDRAAGVITRYEYDADFLVGVDDSRAGRTAIEYDRAGRRTATTAPNGMTSRITYDDAGRVAATVTTDATGTVIDGLAHVYDAAGRRRFDVYHDASITAYRYDDAGRLARVEYPYDGGKRRADYLRFAEAGVVASGAGGSSAGLPGPEAAGAGGTAFRSYLGLSPSDASAIDLAFREIHPLRKGGAASYQPVWTEEFEYDAADNRTVWRTGWGRIGYTYDEKGRLAGSRDLAYSYDMAGNLNQTASPAGSTSYGYSARHRVVSVVGNDRVLSYRYDALGRRIARVDEPDPGGSAGTAAGSLRKPPGSPGSPAPPSALVTLFRYDGLGFDLSSYAQLELVAVSAATDLHKTPLPPTGRVRSAPAAVPDGAVGGHPAIYSTPAVGTLPLSVSGPAGTLHLSHDVLGSVRTASDGSGSGVERYHYDAWGSSLTADASPGQPYGYAGKPVDPVTGHLDHGFRDYAPALGRFTTPDPVRSGGNWYVYVHADPVNLVDLLGLEATSVVIRFDMRLKYLRSAETLTMRFNKLHDGEIVNSVTKRWDATNTIKHRVPKVDPPVRFRGYRHYPGPFPDGVWNVTATGTSPDPMIGRYVRTDAVVDVRTFLVTGAKPTKDTLLTNQDGFLIHGGGYTSNDLYDPLGTNRYEDNTRGCLRLRNDDIAELAEYADRAIETGGTLTIAIGGDR